jgi:hypothetical protein
VTIWESRLLYVFVVLFSSFCTLWLEIGDTAGSDIARQGVRTWSKVKVVGQRILHFRLSNTYVNGLGLRQQYCAEPRCPDAGRSFYGGIDSRVKASRCTRQRLCLNPGASGGRIAMHGMRTSGNVVRMSWKASM